MPDNTRSPNAPQIASWCIAAVVLLLVLWLGLLPALLAGLLVYEIVHVVAPLLQRLFPADRSRLAAVIVLASLTVGLLTAVVFGAAAFFRSDAGSLHALF